MAEKFRPSFYMDSSKDGRGGVSSGSDGWSISEEKVKNSRAALQQKLEEERKKHPERFLTDVSKPSNTGVTVKDLERNKAGIAPTRIEHTLPNGDRD